MYISHKEFNNSDSLEEVEESSTTNDSGLSTPDRSDANSSSATVNSSSLGTPEDEG